MGFQKIFIILSSAAVKNKPSTPLPAGIRYFSLDKSPLSDYNTRESVTVLFFMRRRVL